MKPAPRKRILFISQRIPYPPNKGDKIRSYNELVYLHTFCDIDLVSFVDDPADWKTSPALSDVCSSVHLFPLSKAWAFVKGALSLIMGKSLSEGYFYSSAVQRRINALIRRNSYDFIFCFSSQIARYVWDTGIFTVMDFCDVDSDKFRQYSERSAWPLKWVYRMEWLRLRAYEDRVHGMVNRSVFITPVEVSLFQRGRDLSHVHAVGNGVDTAFFSPHHIPREHSLVFTGDMSYHANVDGVTWFCREVFPAIQKAVPGIRFTIVGRNPTPAVSALAHQNEGVIVTGEVPDVRPYLARACLAVIPLRMARGVQNKVLEAMAMATPVVISRSLYATFHSLPQKDVFVFDSPGDLQETIIAAVKNRKLCEKRGSAQRRYVEHHASWDALFSHSPLYEELRTRC